MSISRNKLLLNDIFADFETITSALGTATLFRIIIQPVTVNKSFAWFYSRVYVSRGGWIQQGSDSELALFA